MAIIGVDPGLSGALVLMTRQHVLSVTDMPIEAKRTGGNRVDARALLRELERLSGIAVIDAACVELVSAMPGQGVTSMFNFGEGCGVLRCALTAIGAPLEYVPAAKWKRDLGLSGRDKSYALTAARELIPGIYPYVTRKKDLGRADAALIAHWYLTRGERGAKK